MVPNEEEFVRFGNAHFRKIAGHYLSQYVIGDCSIDRVYGIRRETVGAFMNGDLPLSVDKNSNVTCEASLTMARRGIGNT